MTKQETLNKLMLVNDYWMRTEPEKEEPTWSVSCYFMGNLMAYECTGRQEYLDSVLKWCRNNEYKISHYRNYEYAHRRLVTFFTEEALLPWKYDDDDDSKPPPKE